MDTEIELEPAVRRIVALANRVERTDRDVPWPRRRQDAAGTSRRLRRLVMPNGPAMASEVDEQVEVHGGRIHVRVYRPGPGRLPVHLFLHGGGWCVGTLDERDPRCRQIAAGADCVVVSVDYRLAPENAFPAAPEDCYRALEWVVAEAGRLDVDPTRLSVSGESAGGNLAAVLAMMARDRGGPRLAHQWLDVPATDMTMSLPSVASTPPGYLLHRDDMVEYRAAYVLAEQDWRHPYASPLLAEDHSELPPAWITTCGADPLRDDGRAYAEALEAAGVPVTHRHLAGHVHPSFAFTRIASAAAHEGDAIAALRRALHP
ncbi:alpha/beta hydrolase [Iamia sp. SCSIO 61187]|uniref:alpha/beta hydrolase n=1 Tax=Iamia sp. SCSIO 61187 TaxID=2722752 RepID=UPI001C6317C3|nr:alpha/beta hydrolase [Iamia sp. SCSIO 61187]QYG91396.1 alpha/beta hydrolase [Iamia sp. SCSIO 61187]